MMKCFGRILTMTALPKSLWTSRGQGLRAAVAMMYPPNPVPTIAKKPIKMRDLQK